MAQVEGLRLADGNVAIYAEVRISENANAFPVLLGVVSADQWDISKQKLEFLKLKGGMTKGFVKLP